MRKLFKEFKQFIAKGNIVDLAIAVVLGNAFNKIVSTLVNSVIMPLIGLATGGASISDWKWVIVEEVRDEAGTILVSENAVAYGAFLQAIIDFLIIAICLFAAMKIVKFSRNKIEKTKTILQKEIKDLTKKDKKKLKKQGIDVDKLENDGEDIKVEEAIKKTETPVTPVVEAALPSNEEKLLTEIRDLLAGKYVTTTTVQVESPSQNKSE